MNHALCENTKSQIFIYLDKIRILKISNSVQEEVLRDCQTQYKRFLWDLCSSTSWPSVMTRKPYEWWLNLHPHLVWNVGYTPWLSRENKYKFTNIEVLRVHPPSCPSRKVDCQWLYGLWSLIITLPTCTDTETTQFDVW